MYIVAHQGGTVRWRGNTMAAFHGIRDVPIAAVELDVHQAADGSIVVAHDPAVGPEQRRIGDLDLATLRSLLPAGDLPLLSEVLDLLRAALLDIQIEIKSDALGCRYPGIVERVLGIVHDLAMTERAVIASFDPAVLSDVLAVAPALRARGALMPAQAEMLGGAFAAIKRYRAAGATVLDVNWRMLDAAVLAAARAEGMLVGVGIVNDAAGLQHWLAQPIDRIITDDPHLALELHDQA